MAFACIDPNWGEPLVMADTIHSTKEGARSLALMSPNCSIYSGANLQRIPPLCGQCAPMENQGYRIAQIRVETDLGDGFAAMPFAVQR